MSTPATLTSALWLVWLAGWMFAARSTATTLVRQSLGARLAHSVFLWTGAALLFFVRRSRLGVLLDPLLPPTGWVAWSGVALTLLGLAYAVWARIHLGRLWSGTVTIKAAHTIVRSGPYSLTRHPIYSGLLFALTGAAMARDTPAALVGYGLLVAGILIKIRQEERLLSGHFGAAYRSYRAEVPALIPRLRRTPRGSLPSPSSR